MFAAVVVLLATGLVHPSASRYLTGQGQDSLYPPASDPPGDGDNRDQPFTTEFPVHQTGDQHDGQQHHPRNTDDPDGPDVNRDKKDEQSPPSPSPQATKMPPVPSPNPNEGPQSRRTIGTPSQSSAILTRFSSTSQPVTWTSTCDVDTQDTLPTLTQSVVMNWLKTHQSVGVFDQKHLELLHQMVASTLELSFRANAALQAITFFLHLLFTMLIMLCLRQCTKPKSAPAAEPSVTPRQPDPPPTSGPPVRPVADARHHHRDGEVRSRDQRHHDAAGTLGAMTADSVQDDLRRENTDLRKSIRHWQSLAHKNQQRVQYHQLQEAGSTLSLDDEVTQSPNSHYNEQLTYRSLPRASTGAIPKKRAPAPPPSDSSIATTNYYL